MANHFYSRLHRTARRFLSHDGGNVVLLTGLAIFILLAASGSAIDLGTQQMVKNRLQQATDAAALAAARLPDTATDQQRTATAMRYFTLNYPIHYLGTTRPPLKVDFNNGKIIASTPEITVPTIFISLSGAASSAASSSSTTGIEASNNTTKYDMILVLDTSGSMMLTDNGPISRMDALKAAANTLVTNLLANGGGNNRMAGITWNGAVVAEQPYTADEQAMHSFINAMTPTGSTNSTAGLAAALAMKPETRTDSDVAKVIILLTDGVNNETVTTNTSSLLTANTIKGDGGFFLYTIGLGTSVSGPNCEYYSASYTNGSKPATGDQRRDPVYCPQPFLAAIASPYLTDNIGNGQPSHPVKLPSGKYENQGLFYFIAPTPAELTRTFSAITTSVRNMRLVE